MVSGIINTEGFGKIGKLANPFIKSQAKQRKEKPPIL
jgi:hypothetical protein